MFDWLLRVTASPWLLVVVVVVGCFVSAGLVVFAKMHRTGSSGIDAGKIHHMRFESRLAE